MLKRLAFHRHDWAAFLKDNPFDSLLISTAGVPITYILLSDFEHRPAFLALDPKLTILCFVLAFLRVWKTAREEDESADVWDELNDSFNWRMRTMDLVVEPAYLFAIFVMPFAAVAFQVFALLLGLFYITDGLYNWMILHMLGPCQEANRYTAEERYTCPVQRYFCRRQALDIVCLMLLIAFGTLSWKLALGGNLEAATMAGWICAGSILLLEAVVEPIWNRKVYGDATAARVTVKEVGPGNPITPEEYAAFERIHLEAFPPEERQYTAEYMAKHAGMNGKWLWMPQFEGNTVGYMFYGTNAPTATAYLWYFAISKDWRGYGFGSYLIARLFRELDSSPVPVKYLLLESHTPKPDATSDDLDRRRIAFYRRLGFHWVRGIEYMVASNTNPADTLHYDILAYPIAGPVILEELRHAIRVMANGNFEPGDERAARFEHSLNAMFIQPPPKREAREEE